MTRLARQLWILNTAAILHCSDGLQVVRHAAMLRKRGYAVVTNPVADADLVDSCAAHCHSTLNGLLAEVEAAGCDTNEQMYRFHNICHRQRKRWDILIPRQSNARWARLLDAAMATAAPIIREAQGSAFTEVSPLMCGAVISRPGARVQRFHVDATHAHFAASRADPSIRMYTVFIPLVAISEDGDGTMFWPSPVLDESSRALAKHMLGAPDSALDAGDLDAPATPAGGLIIFDYRTIHRGLANAEVGGRERPVAYITYATGGARDEHNFPRTTTGGISLERARALPFWNRGSAAQDKLEYYTEIEGDGPFDLPKPAQRESAPLQHVAHEAAPRQHPSAALPLRARGHGVRRAMQPPCMMSAPTNNLEEARSTAREMHAEALKYSETTYHSSGTQPDPSETALPEWDCYSFPGSSSGLGADSVPPGGFGKDELARVSRGPLLSAMDCESIIAEAEAMDAWVVSPRVAHYARQAGCLTPLDALPKSLAMLSPFLASRLFPAIRNVRNQRPPLLYFSAAAHVC